MSSSWLEELEARLEQQLEAFLQANPQQEALLAEQEIRDRQRSLQRERIQLRQDAELKRQSLLALAEEIRQWQARVQRARGAGAQDLATRAQAHIDSLMARGRDQWAALGDLGQRFSKVQEELDALAQRRPTSPPPGGAVGGAGAPQPAGDASDLEAEWAAFEAQQELRELQRRLQR